MVWVVCMGRAAEAAMAYGLFVGFRSMLLMLDSVGDARGFVGRDAIGGVSIIFGFPREDSSSGVTGGSESVNLVGVIVVVSCLALVAWLLAIGVFMFLHCNTS